MIDWTVSDQMFEHPIQKQVVLFLLRSVFELSSACLRALASSLPCSCSVNVGTFSVTNLACCRAWKWCGCILSGGGLLFVSLIVVSLDMLLWTPEGMALNHTLVWMISVFGHFSCCIGLRCTWNCGFPLAAQTSNVQAWKEVPCFNGHLGVILFSWDLSQ